MHIEKHRTFINYSVNFGGYFGMQSCTLKMYSEIEKYYEISSQNVCVFS